MTARLSSWLRADGPLFIGSPSEKQVCKDPYPFNNIPQAMEAADEEMPLIHYLSPEVIFLFDLFPKCTT